MRSWPICRPTAAPNGALLALGGDRAVRCGAGADGLSRRLRRGTAGEVCTLWLEAPQQFHDRLAVVLSFLFGGSWTATISAFLGYLGLAAYGVGLIQFLVVRLPKQGRLAGGF